MSVNLALPEPFVIDLLHCSLIAVIVVLLLIFLIARRTAVVTSTSSSESENTSDKVATESNQEVKPHATLKELSPDAALQLLSLLQQEARLIDFLNEDLTGFSDADIGAVARVVHEGGCKVLKTYFELAPVRQETEESVIEVPVGFDAQRVRLTGNVRGEPPYRGTLTHRGWQISQVKLPQLAQGHQTEIIAPAEVEV